MENLKKMKLRVYESYFRHGFPGIAPEMADYFGEVVTVFDWPHEPGEYIYPDDERCVYIKEDNVRFIWRTSWFEEIDRCRDFKMLKAYQAESEKI